MSVPNNEESSSSTIRNEHAGLLATFQEDSDNDSTDWSSVDERNATASKPSRNVKSHAERTVGSEQQTGIERIFSNGQIFFFALTYMSAWEAIVGNLTTVLWNGGPRSLAWGTLFVVTGALAQSASLAEMAAIHPIAGAQYRWTAYFARTRHARFLTWLQGWMTCFAWVSTLSGSVNFAAYIIRGIVVLNYEAYNPERWHLTLLIICMLLIHALVNMYTFRLIPWIETIAGYLHVGLFVVFMSVLLLYAPKQSAEYVFVSTSNGASGWDSNFISFNLGLSTSVWGFVGFDGAVSMSEDVKDARTAVPRAMVWSIAINGVLAYAMSIAILFCTTSPDEVLTSPYPIMTIIVNATGSYAIATAMCCGLLMISVSANLGSVASASRLAWAWARDGVLPAYFSYVDSEQKTPVRALWLPVIITMLLSLLNIISSVAFGAFIALAAMAMYSCYMIAISCMLYARMTRPGVQLAGWNLGRFGPAVNIFALAYSAYIFLWLPFPAFLPVTTTNMNYALVLWSFALSFAIISWWAWGRRKWPGLNEKVTDIVMADID